MKKNLFSFLFLLPVLIKAQNVVSASVTVTQTPCSPAISVSPAVLTTYTTTVGTPSTSETFTISAVALSSNVTIAASANFEVSASSSTGFASGISLAPTSGSIVNTTVYARYNPASAGTQSGSISLSSSGATTQTVTVSGTSSPSGIDELIISGNYKLKISPSPVNQTTVISWQLIKREPVTASIIDVTGKKVFEKSFGTLNSGSYSEAIDMKELPNGVYFIKLNNATIKTIKE